MFDVNPYDDLHGFDRLQKFTDELHSLCFKSGVDFPKIYPLEPWPSGIARHVPISMKTRFGETRFVCWEKYLLQQQKEHGEALLKKDAADDLEMAQHYINEVLKLVK